MSFPKDGVCFRCKGCGQPAFYFPTGLGDDIPPGAVAHSKPSALLRRSNDQPSNVPCVLYQQLGARAFWLLHEDAERLEPPSRFEKNSE